MDESSGTNRSNDLAIIFLLIQRWHAVNEMKVIDKVVNKKRRLKSFLN